MNADIIPAATERISQLTDEEINERISRRLVSADQPVSSTRCPHHPGNRSRTLRPQSSTGLFQSRTTRRQPFSRRRPSRCSQSMKDFPPCYAQLYLTRGRT